MAKRTQKQGRADLHGRGSARMAARRLTPREVEELSNLDVPQPGDRRRLDGIQELRRALNDRFGASPNEGEEVNYA